jgi:hypothetical protein
MSDEKLVMVVLYKLGQEYGGAKVFGFISFLAAYD